MKYKTLKAVLLAGVATVGFAQAGVVATDVAMGATAPQQGGGFMQLGSGQNELPMLQRGTQELGIGGAVDLNDGVGWDLRFNYGWFVADNWQIGFTIDWAGQDGDVLENIRAGLFTEYNFATGTRWVPYIGANAVFASSGDRFNSANDLINGDEGVAFGGELGLKYFIRSHMAVYGAARFTWSPDDILGAGDEIADSLTNIEIGMRFYF